MPEIAEVETVRNTLKHQILGKKIKQIKVLYEPIIASDNLEFKTVLIGETIKDISRIGKWLIFETEKYCLLSHLRMEGKYFLKKQMDPIEKHEHIIITFQDNTDLRYQDTRKFGRMMVTLKENLYEIEAIKKQGMEPNDPKLTPDYLYSKIYKKNLPIKTLLLDQTIISGLGNIYANEILFAAKINPFKKGKEITKEECEKLISSTNKIIKEAIQEGGTTIKSYTSSLGVTGRFQQHLMVYKREQENCKICSSMIKNEKLGGRSTYYCPTCQNKKEL